MTILWIIIAIALLFVIFWLLTQPKQGTRASNAPRSTPPEGLPSGENSAVSSKAHPNDYPLQAERASSSEIKSQPNTNQSTPPPSLEAEIQQLLNAGQKIVAESGYVPLPADQRQMAAK